MSIDPYRQAIGDNSGSNGGNPCFMYLVMIAVLLIACMFVFMYATNPVLFWTLVSAAALAAIIAVGVWVYRKIKSPE